MHNDEFRDPKQLKQLRIAETVSDQESLYAKLNKLDGEAYAAEINKLEGERVDLNCRIADSRRALKELKQQNSILKNERNLANERLDKLRRSRTMKVGRTLTGPANIVRKFVRDPKGASKKSAREFNRQWRKLRSTLKARKVTKLGVFPTRNNEAHARSAGTRISSSCHKFEAIVSPLDVFVNKPGIENFETALNYLWFTKGEIQRTRQLIEDNPKFVAELGEVPKSLAVRVLGESRILDSKLISQRCEFPAYVAEPNRLMYCVHQSPVFNSNGYSTRTRGVANGLNAAGGDVVVVARSGYPWDSKADVAKPKTKRYVTELDDVQYVHVPGGNLNREPIDQYVMQAADAFVREARILRPSIIQAASNFRTALPALIAARRLGIPFVYEVRGLWEFTEAASKPGFEETERFEAMRKLETLVAKNADHVLAITSQIKDELVRRGVSPDSISIAPNSVDPHVYLPIPKDTEFAKSKKINTEVPVIGFAGSIVGYEGLDLLIEASAILRKKAIKHQIVIAGSGAAEAELKKQAGTLDLGDTIRFLGRLPQDEMPRLQSTFDIVACPRRSNRVTEMVSPLKPLESFASGKAAVLSDVAPNRDLAGDGQDRALLFDADSAGSLATQLEKLILNPEVAGNIERTARLWVVRQRSWTKLGERILDAHRTATNVYKEKTPDSQPLDSLYVGVIGDEFTRSTLEDAFDIELLGRKTWRRQLETEPKFDLIFVESAWEGNEGEWHRGIGHYSDKESADLRGLLELAREKSIPTVFWNKEDPIHIARFAPNAALFDHVFTTDANMIPRYLNTDGCRNVSVSALPFYAQPKLHNPLPVGREHRESIAYAGSYYGERYKERSKELERLLEASSKYPLDIYDRQANNPNSPYKFPEAYRDFVRGGLPYKEVVESYKSHIAHLNVNSVLDSPTMFSRRVVEIPACGGIVLSAYGRGISETLGSNIAHSKKKGDYRAWLLDWTTNPTARLNEIWRQMRTVYRSHTTDTALSILARTAGLSVRGLKPIAYAAHIDIDGLVSADSRKERIMQVVNQSVRPCSIVLSNFRSEDKNFIERLGIEAYPLSELPTQSDAIVYFPERFSRTYAEDVLLPLRFGDYSSVYTASTVSHHFGQAVVSPVAGSTKELRLAATVGESRGDSVRILLPEECLPAERIRAENLDIRGLRGKTVLVAGHDLKFATAILEQLNSIGCVVLIDEWNGHNKHDEERSSELLRQADAVVCEWGLGNAVWYSQNVKANQPLIVRVHSQELFLPYLKQIDKSSVDHFVFVGELIRKAAIESHGVPCDKTTVIPNFVDVERLNQQKTADAAKTLGFVGIVPKSKRLDRVLDVLELLLTHDDEYKLRIKGKTPEDYPWMKNRPDEMAFYANQYERISTLNKRYPDSVVFDGYGADMADWYRNVGVVISTSEFESFHLTVADGAASGAVPVSIAWPGSDLIYPIDWLSGTTEEMVKSILEQHVNGQEAQRFVQTNFRTESTLENFFELLGEVLNLHFKYR